MGNGGVAEVAALWRHNAINRTLLVVTMDNKGP